ncbi:trypsin-like peptidase domain-containing protein [candidate division KSB1 bacterium]|nr:trypsin-like peptidase domain-containing protein [candidate division KSB1 bacterium]
MIRSVYDISFRICINIVAVSLLIHMINGIRFEQLISSQAYADTISDPITESRHNAITRAVEKVSPAVVGINIIQVKYYIRPSPFSDDPFFRHFFSDIPIKKKVKSLGSGFLFQNDGYILTNQHVIQNATEIIVTVAGGQQYMAKVVGEDIVTDVAVLKIEGKKFPVVEFGNSDEVLIGEWSIALGNPFGLFDRSSSPIVTVGVISAKGQDFGRLDNEHIYENMLQTDAAINGGNSGGPLVNSDGNVIGMNTWIISGSETKSANIGIGFAIPINRVNRIINDLMLYGYVDRSFWTGIYYHPMTVSAARKLGLQSVYGVLITGIDKSSPAEKAGLRVDDIIVAINGQDVNDYSDVKNIRENSDLKKGDTITLRIFRKKSFYTKIVQLEAHPDTYKR